MLTFAGVPVTHDQVRATLGLFRYYHRFLASEFERCRNPESGWPGGEMTKDQVRARLGFLVNVAINRKAGILDYAGRKQDPDYQIELWRDCQEIREHRKSRRRLWGLNGRRFRTDEIQARYGHLLDND